VENWKAFAGGWAPFLDEAECCLWRTLFLDGGKVPIIEGWISSRNLRKRYNCNIPLSAVNHILIPV